MSALRCVLCDVSAVRMGHRNIGRARCASKKCNDVVQARPFKGSSKAIQRQSESEVFVTKRNVNKSNLTEATAVELG